MSQATQPAQNGPVNRKTAAIYARVSTEDQGKGFSLPTQIEACQKLAEREAYAVPESHLLIDEGISGTTMDRPGLRKLRELVNTHAIAAAIVYDPDRLSRNLGHQLLMAEEFDQAAVKLLIVSHPLEQGPEGWLFFQMRGALAEYERAKILERTARGSLGRVKAGNPWGGQVPLGCRAIREPHKARWEIEEEEAALVRRIFAMCLEGMTTHAIARQLTEERVPTRVDRGGQGRKRLGVGVWGWSAVHKILTYEGYTGRAYWNKEQRISKTRRVLRPREEWIEIPVPAILTMSEFEAVQGQLTRNKALARRNRRATYLLVGRRLRCGRCGRTMSGRISSRGVRYYRCTSLFNVLDPAQRCRGYLRAETAEAAVWAAVQRVLEQPELIAQEVVRRQQQQGDEQAGIDAERALIAAALEKCDREDARWTRAYGEEVISLAELKLYRADVAARRAGLLAHQEELQGRVEAIAAAAAQAETLTAYCVQVRERLHTFGEADQQRALEALQIRATWTPGQPLMIEGTIPMATVSMPPGCRARDPDSSRSRSPAQPRGLPLAPARHSHTGMRVRSR